MSNFFDQFDEPEKPAAGNFFDQFDEPAQTDDPWDAYYSSLERQPEGPPEKKNDGILSALASGVRNTAANIGITFDAWRGDVDAATEGIEAAREIPKTDSQKAFMGALDAREDTGTFLGAVGDVASAAWQEPVGALHEVVAQLPNSATAMLGMAGGAKAAAMAAAPLGPVAMAIAAFAGGWVGASFGTSMVETGAIAQGKFDDGVITGDELSESTRQSVIKSGTIGLVDRVTMGVTGMIFGAASRTGTKAVTDVLVENGVDVASEQSVKAALNNPVIAQQATAALESVTSNANTLAKRAGRGAAGMGLESFSEGAGEYVGSLLAGLDPSMRDAVLESMLSLPQSTIELMVSRGKAPTGTPYDKLFEEAGIQQQLDAMRSRSMEAEAEAAAQQVLAAGGDNLDAEIARNEAYIRMEGQALQSPRSQPLEPTQAPQTTGDGLQFNPYQQTMQDPLRADSISVNGRRITPEPQQDPNTIDYEPGSPAPREFSLVDMAEQEAKPAPAGERVTVWTGRRGDGYPTEGMAQSAVPRREKDRQDLDWRVERMPSGKYQIVGYGKPRGIDGPVAQQGQPGAAPAAPATATPAVAADLSQGAQGALPQQPSAAPRGEGFALAVETEAQRLAREQSEQEAAKASEADRKAREARADMPRALEVVDDLQLVQTSGQASIVDRAANEAATSPQNDLPEPTQAQKQAGNYKVGRARIQGMDISIENPRGSVRSGKRPDGSEWSNRMKSHYGYIRRTEGADGDHIDVYVGPSPNAGTVYVVDQINADGSFDEHKAMLGYDSQAKAEAAYLENYDAGWKIGPVTAMPIAEFKSWAESGDTKGPLQPDRISQTRTLKTAQEARAKEKAAAKLKSITITETVLDENGNEVVIEQSADAALRQIDKRISVLQSLLDCVSS
jgi:hypothetical protein